MQRKHFKIKYFYRMGGKVAGEQRKTIAHLYLESGSTNKHTYLFICLLLLAGFSSFQTLHIRAAVMQLQPRHVKISALLFGKVLKQTQLFMSEILSELIHT